MLNHVIRWNPQKGIEYEVDLRPLDVMIKQLHLERAKSVVSPGAKEEGTTKEWHPNLLDEARTHEYRALVARANYLAPDGADISFAVKELARKMNAPTEEDWLRSKHLVRY